ncbi:hypothetical protein L195_g064111, partial [Trifolium pratense]
MGFWSDVKSVFCTSGNKLDKHMGLLKEKKNGKLVVKGLRDATGGGVT